MEVIKLNDLVRLQCSYIIIAVGYNFISWMVHRKTNKWLTSRGPTISMIVTLLIIGIFFRHKAFYL